jgi:hypothetical protein
VGSWRVEDLDAEPRVRRRPFIGPWEIALLASALVASITLVPRWWPTPTPPPPAAPARPASLATTLALGSQQLTAGTCGVLSAATPPQTYDGVVQRVSRIDASVMVAFDAYWSWCVAGARFYDDGVEIVGRFIPIREATGGPRPRAALRSTTISGRIAGFGALGPGSFASDGGYDILRLRAVSDDHRRSDYPHAVSGASVVGLQLSSVRADFGVIRAANDEDPAVIVAERDAGGAVVTIYVSALDAFSVRLNLS